MHNEPETTLTSRVEALLSDEPLSPTRVANMLGIKREEAASALYALGQAKRASRHGQTCSYIRYVDSCNPLAGMEEAMAVIARASQHKLLEEA